MGQENSKKGRYNPIEEQHKFADTLKEGKISSANLSQTETELLNVIFTETGIVKPPQRNSVEGSQLSISCNNDKGGRHDVTHKEHGFRQNTKDNNEIQHSENKNQDFVVDNNNFQTDEHVVLNKPNLTKDNNVMLNENPDKMSPKCISPNRVSLGGGSIKQVSFDESSIEPQSLRSTIKSSNSFGDDSEILTPRTDSDVLTPRTFMAKYGVRKKSLYEKSIDEENSNVGSANVKKTKTYSRQQALDEDIWSTLNIEEKKERNVEPNQTSYETTLSNEETNVSYQPKLYSSENVDVLLLNSTLISDDSDSSSEGIVIAISSQRIEQDVSESELCKSHLTSPSTNNESGSLSDGYNSDNVDNIDEEFISDPDSTQSTVIFTPRSTCSDDLEEKEKEEPVNILTENCEVMYSTLGEEQSNKCDNVIESQKESNQNENSSIVLQSTTSHCKNDTHKNSNHINMCENVNILEHHDSNYIYSKSEHQQRNDKIQTHSLSKKNDDQFSAKDNLKKEPNCLSDLTNCDTNSAHKDAKVVSETDILSALSTTLEGNNLAINDNKYVSTGEVVTVPEVCVHTNDISHFTSCGYSTAYSSDAENQEMSAKPPRPDRPPQYKNHANKQPGINQHKNTKYNGKAEKNRNDSDSGDDSTDSEEELAQLATQNTSSSGKSYDEESTSSSRQERPSNPSPPKVIRDVDSSTEDQSESEQAPPVPTKIWDTVDNFQACDNEISSTNKIEGDVGEMGRFNKVEKDYDIENESDNSSIPEDILLDKELDKEKDSSMKRSETYTVKSPEYESPYAEIEFVDQPVVTSSISKTSDSQASTSRTEEVSTARSTTYTFSARSDMKDEFLSSNSEFDYTYKQEKQTPKVQKQKTKKKKSGCFNFGKKKEKKKKEKNFTQTIEENEDKLQDILASTSKSDDTNSLKGWSVVSTDRQSNDTNVSKVENENIQTLVREPVMKKTARQRNKERSEKYDPAKRTKTPIYRPQRPKERKDSVDSNVSIHSKHSRYSQSQTKSTNSNTQETSKCSENSDSNTAILIMDIHSENLLPSNSALSESGYIKQQADNESLIESETVSIEHSEPGETIPSLNHSWNRHEKDRGIMIVEEQNHHAAYAGDITVVPIPDDHVLNNQLPVYGNAHFDKENNKIDPAQDEDDLSIKEISLDKQPRKRLSRAKRKELERQGATSVNPGANLDTDSDASMESNCSAGLFEHVAKMGRIVDSVPPVPVNSSPKVMFRSSFTPMGEIGSLPPAEPYTFQPTQTQETKENDVPVKLKTDPLNKYSAMDANPDNSLNIVERAERERVRNKQRQKELQRRLSESSLASSTVQPEKDIDTLEAERRARKKERKRAKRQQKELEALRLAEPHGGKQEIHRALADARNQRWRQSKPGYISDDSVASDKLPRNMRAAPKQRTRTPSMNSDYSHPSARSQELLQQLQHQKHQHDQQQQLRKAAQDLINQAYNDTANQHRRDSEQASQLLNEAFPLADSSLPKVVADSAPLSPTHSHKSGGSKSNKSDPGGIAGKPKTPPPSGSALDKLFSNGNIDRPNGPSRAWTGSVMGGGQPMTNSERDQLLSAIRDELKNLQAPKKS